MKPNFVVCPHCWGVSTFAESLCARCGADPRTWLQESGGLRNTAAVQSPVPVARGRKLTRTQRAGAAACLLLLALWYVVVPLSAGLAWERVPAAASAP